MMILRQYKTQTEEILREHANIKFKEHKSQKTKKRNEPEKCKFLLNNWELKESATKLQIQKATREYNG